MEIRHLRYFTAVASELHFARAAHRLNISPPTLTQQIKSLETHLGVQLFIRSGTRKVELTFAGKQFQKRALALIESFDQTERSAREAARGEIGDVRVGYVITALVGGYVKRTIEITRAVSPHIQLNIHKIETLAQIKAIASGGLDIGFIRGLDMYPPGLVAFELPPHRLLLAVHRSHPLAKQKVITSAALASQNFVAYELDAEIGFLRNIAAVLPAGAIPHIVRRAPDALSLLALVSANVGLAVVPESFKAVADADIVFRQIAGPDRFSRESVVFRANETSPAVRAVTAAIKSKFGKTRSRTRATSARPA